MSSYNLATFFPSQTFLPGPGKQFLSLSFNSAESVKTFCKWIVVLDYELLPIGLKWNHFQVKYIIAAEMKF